MNRVVQIRYSRDGGRNWSAWRERSLGDLGEFMKRVRCLRLGQGRQWVFEWKVTDAVRADCLGASLQVESAQ